MIESTLSKRYARALLELAQKESTEKLYLESLQNLSELVNSHPHLRIALENPFFDLASRLRVVEALSVKMGFDRIFINFLKILTKNGRMNFLKDIVVAYQNLYFQKEGMLEAVVTTAKEMPTSFYDQIKTILGKKTGKKIMCQPNINVSVLGGVSITLDGKMYDGTILSDLNRLGYRLKNVSAGHF
ncbi:MAG: H+-transporting two-sector ATPase, delta (OSCP) subunit [uncultured bacterium]|nr:MAG: H+-transporting two-sector ATPase, delta (OSCP) subunit [uncultured bacterium]